MPVTTVEALRQMRLRQAVMVTALLRAGPLIVSPRDIFESAAHDIRIEPTDAGFQVSLVPAPKDNHA